MNTDKKHIESLYTEYGRFAVQFEHLCEQMRLCILQILNANGLKDQFITKILLAEIDAYTLQVKIRGLYIHLYPDDKKGKQVVIKIMNKVVKLLEDRNNVIHGTWYFDWVKPSLSKEPISAFGYKHKVGNKGLNLNHRNYTISDFKELYQRTSQLAELVGRLSGCLTHPDLKVCNNITEEMIDTGRGFAGNYWDGTK